MTKKIYDVSLSLSKQLATWPSDPKIKITQTRFIEKGASSNVSYLQMGSHTGTHVDAPHHFIDGNRTVDQLPLEILWGKVKVISLPLLRNIEPKDLKKQSWKNVERVLFKTKNSQFWSQKKHRFTKKYAALSLEAAEFLVSKKVKLIGIDYLSIGEYKGTSKITHQTLLKAGVVVIEGLSLSQVPAGNYEMVCAPLKIQGGDGAPARVFLKQ